MKRFAIYPERCNGCLSCTLACSAAHSRSGDIVGAMLERIPARIKILSVDGFPVPVKCGHCEEPACVDACMAGAMRKDPATGIVANEGNEQRCVGCWMCIMACPYGVITQSREEPRTAVKCDGCQSRKGGPACVEACHNGALTLEDIEDIGLPRQLAGAGRTLKKAGPV